MLLSFAAARLHPNLRTSVLGALAGLGYGVLAVCARILPGFAPHQLIRSPAAYALVAAGIISFMLYASALESGQRHGSDRGSETARDHPARDCRRAAAG